MAASKSFNEDDVACRYFLSGTCRDGENCLFSHDRTRRIPDTICRYYLQGICLFGENCWYDHILLNKDIIQETYSNSERQSTDPSLFCSSSQGASYNFTMNDTNKCDFYEGRCANFTLGFPENRDRNIEKSVSSSTDFYNSTSEDFINNAPKVPHIRSYADTLKANTVMNNESEHPLHDEICPLFAVGNCPFKNCQLIHGNMCELCHKAYLHPFNEQVRKSHIEKCEKELEQDMEFSFAIQRSLDKTCGICMDVILEKEPLSERRFGILEKCNHVYCLSCIRKWRSSRQHEYRESTDLDLLYARACPECRIASDFVIPNDYFVDSEEEKQKIITDYKKALSKKHCKYFKRGIGACPFGGACFYLHAKPDGTKVDLPLPLKRLRQNQDGEIDYVRDNYLWDYVANIEENANIRLTSALVFDLIGYQMDYASDTSDSDSVSDLLLNL